MTLAQAIILNYIAAFIGLFLFSLGLYLLVTHGFEVPLFFVMAAGFYCTLKPLHLNWKNRQLVDDES